MASGRTAMSSPALSVVLPVHNAERFLDECIASIVSQDFPDFELVIFDDRSTDDSPARLADWARRDERIRLERGERRLGAAGSSNRVTELARAPLIARMDADDVMLPGRLKAQVEAFAARPDAVLLGGLAWTIDASGRRVRPPDLARLLRASPYAPFPHSTAMFRRSAWQQAGGYRAAAEKWEDVDFFLRMREQGAVWTLTQPVIEYRQHTASTRSLDGFAAWERAMDAMVRAVEPGLRRSGKIAPNAYRHIGATLLWSGARPRLLARILRRAELGFDRASLALLGWASMAGTAPGLLRAVLRARLALANRTARRRLRGCDLVEWQ